MSGAQAGERPRPLVLSEREQSMGLVASAPASPASRAHGGEVAGPREPAVASPDPDALLSVRGLEVRAGRARLLSGVDVDVLPGRVTAVLGTGGAGKSTLLRAVAGLDRPSAGIVALDGDDVAGLPAHAIARRRVALVAGGREAASSLSVAESLRLAAASGGADEGQRAMVSKLFGALERRADQRVGTLSGGERQQLALAQALLRSPRLLLIDELSLGLSPAIAAELAEAVRAIARAGTAVLMVEQSVQLALDLASQAVFLDRGKAVFAGPTHELLERPELLRAVFLHRPGGAPARAARPRAEPAEPLLDVKGVSASYGGVQALTGVDLRVASGEVVGLVGPNGAGKSTLLDVITGFTAPDSGQVALAGEELAALAPHQRAARGLVRSAQTPRLFGGLTSRECVAVARERHLDQRDPFRPAVWAPSARRSEARTLAEADARLDLLGLSHLASRTAAELSVGERRLVEIACALAAEPQVLALDEPCAGLSTPARLRIRDLIAAVSAEGVGVLLVEHDLDVVAAACDRVLVLHLGRPLAEGSPAEVLSQPAVMDAYIGAAGGAGGRVGQALGLPNDQGATR